MFQINFSSALILKTKLQAGKNKAQISHFLPNKILCVTKNQQPF